MEKAIEAMFADMDIRQALRESHPNGIAHEQLRRAFDNLSLMIKIPRRYG
jgi:hypothetical protein